MFKLFKAALAVIFPLILTMLAAAWYLNTNLNKELPLADASEVFVLAPGTG
jgi:hypothetical protein